jgi:hypothetical protein
VVPVTTFVVLAIVGSVPMFVFLRAVDAPDARAVRRSRSG